MRNKTRGCRKTFELTEKEQIELFPFKSLMWLKILVVAVSLMPIIICNALLILMFFSDVKTEDVTIGAFLFQAFSVGVSLKLYESIKNIVIKIRLKKLKL